MHTTRMHTHTHAHTDSHTHARAHTYTHTHTHTHTPVAYHGNQDNETEEKVFKKRKVFKEDLERRMFHQFYQCCG